MIWLKEYNIKYNSNTLAQYTLGLYADQHNHAPTLGTNSTKSSSWAQAEQFPILPRIPNAKNLSWDCGAKLIDGHCALKCVQIAVQGCKTARAVPYPTCILGGFRGCWISLNYGNQYMFLRSTHIAHIKNPQWSAYRGAKQQNTSTCFWKTIVPLSPK